MAAIELYGRKVIPLSESCSPLTALPTLAGSERCQPSSNRYQVRTERIAMTVSFKTHILPLFTKVDIEHMSYAGVSLDDYAYMSEPANASVVYEQVSTRQMPPSDSGEQPWSPDQVQLFKAWMDGGYKR
jgi:hypothetical protein